MKTCGDCTNLIYDKKRKITICFEMEQTNDMEDDYMHPDAEICDLFKIKNFTKCD